MRIANRSSFVVAFALTLFGWEARIYAQKGPETTLTKLPQDHDYQRTLRKFMASLTPKDFTHGVAGVMPQDSAANTDPEYLYRQYILTMMHQPLIGTKRGTPSVVAPPALFMLSSIETPKGVMPPPVWPETLTPFVHWDYPGNLYRNNRALKHRAFVGAAVQMIMFHNFVELNDEKTPPVVRPDWHGYNLVIVAAPYPGFKDVLPADVQKAYETGLKMLGERVLGWGIRGENCAHDLIAPVGLIYVSRVLGDSAFAKKVETHTRKLFTDPRYVHPAGYWIERGGIDMGAGGMANYFAVWAALMTDWPFTKEALDRIYRLRSHLILPEPDGLSTGPSHFNSRLGSPANVDQWNWDGARETAAAMVTDEAAHFIQTPSPDDLAKAPGRRAQHFNDDIRETPRDTTGRHIRPDEIANLYPWKLRMWSTYNFPASVNPGYEFYRKGAFAHRQDLEKRRSPLLQSPFLRGENFIRDFEKVFVVARQPDFAAIVHAGPIGTQSADDNMTQYKGPMGLSGGQLSAFWTPTTGSVLLGLREWMSRDKSLDEVDAWRTWPNHSVSGATADGVFFTSARIQKPDAVFDIQKGQAVVKVAGTIPSSIVGQVKTIAGKYDYARSLKIDEKGVRVETTVRGDGRELVAELYEVLPVYLRESRRQVKEAPTAIEFQVGGVWSRATEKATDKVQAVRLTRFKGAVLVTFDQPRRVKLSPTEWADTGFTRSTSRNVLIDLLESGDNPATLQEAKKVAYRIEAAVKE